MYRKIFKTGNSFVISISREILEGLHLQVGSEVSVDLDRDNRCIVIRPVQTVLSEAAVDEVFARQVDRFIEQYRTALEALAKK